MNVKSCYVSRFSRNAYLFIVFIRFKDVNKKTYFLYEILILAKKINIFYARFMKHMSIYLNFSFIHKHVVLNYHGFVLFILFLIRFFPFLVLKTQLPRTTANCRQADCPEPHQAVGSRASTRHWSKRTAITKCWNSDSTSANTNPRKSLSRRSTTNYWYVLISVAYDLVLCAEGGWGWIKCLYIYLLPSENIFVSVIITVVVTKYF